MRENTCSTCRWWKQGVRNPDHGACENPDVGLFVGGTGASFAPQWDFTCSLHEPSSRWAEEAAEEIDAWFHGAYKDLPGEAAERVHVLAKIILEHRDRAMSAPVARGRRGARAVV
jgi:hypothetical protein